MKFYFSSLKPSILIAVVFFIPLTLCDKAEASTDVPTGGSPSGSGCRMSCQKSLEKPRFTQTRYNAKL